MLIFFLATFFSLVISQFYFTVFVGESDWRILGVDVIGGLMFATDCCGGGRGDRFLSRLGYCDSINLYSGFDEPRWDQSCQREDFGYWNGWRVGQNWRNGWSDDQDCQNDLEGPGLSECLEGGPWLLELSERGPGLSEWLEGGPWLLKLSEKRPGLEE